MEHTANWTTGPDQEHSSDTTTGPDQEPAVDTTTGAYRPPVSALLEVGDARDSIQDWPDYRALGLTTADIPELIRLASDHALHWAEDESPEIWAPIHAWRALGQLGAVEAVEPLLALHDPLEDSDWILEELPEVYGLIGPAAVPALSRYVLDDTPGLWARVAASGGLKRIAAQHPEERAAVIDVLTSLLRRHTELDTSLTSSLVDHLIELKATETAALIEEAFAAGSIIESMVGDWEDVQIELGLLSERITPRPHYGLGLSPSAKRPPPVIISRAETTRQLAFDDESLPLIGSEPASSRGKDARKAKVKRKMAAQSRRQNKRRR